MCVRSPARATLGFHLTPRPRLAYPFPCSVHIDFAYLRVVGGLPFIPRAPTTDGGRNVPTDTAGWRSPRPWLG